MPGLVAAALNDQRIYRIGPRHDPWALPDWAYADAETRTFGHRYDDPQGDYRVCYASLDVRGCLLETLACFRPDLETLAVLDQMEGDDEYLRGAVPLSWFDERALGIADTTAATAVDVGDSETLNVLRPLFAATAVEAGFTDVDIAAITSAAPRILTQHISRYIYEQGVNGILYPCRHDRSILNLALFEQGIATNPGGFSVPIRTFPLELIQPSDVRVQRALTTLGLTVGSAIPRNAR